MRASDRQTDRQTGVAPTREEVLNSEKPGLKLLTACLWASY